MLLSSLFLVALRPQNPAPKLRLVPGAGEQRIVDIEVSADARRVVTNGLVMGAYHSNATRLWDAKRGRVIAVFTHSWPIYSTDLSDRANRVLTVSKDEAKVWDATTGALVKRITSPEKEKFDRGAISPDGTHVILGTESAVVVSMAVEGSEEPKTSVIGGFGLSSLSYSKDGAFVVATPKIFDDEKPVQPVVLRAATLEPVSKLDDPRGASRVAELSPQGDRALTVAPGEKLDRARLFNVPDGRLLFERPYEDANEFETSAPATFVGKDGEAIAVPQANGTIALVDGRDGHAVGELLGVTGPLVAIKASPDGAVLAAAGLDGKIRAWTVSDRQPIPLPDSDARGVALAYSTDGQTLFAGEANGSLRRIDLRQCSVSSPLGPGSRIFADLLTFPNGRFAFGQRRGKSWQWQTFDALSRTESRVRLPLSERPPVFAADGTRAVILAPNGKPGALIVNVATGRVQSVPDASVAAWNSKGTWILTFGPNGVVRRFDGLTFAQTHSGSMKVKGAPRECAISPDGKTAAVVGYLSPEISKQELTVLWDVAAGKPLDVPFTSVDPKTKIHFSPNGKLLGLLDEHRILLYEMSTKTSKVAELFGPLKLDGKNLPATLHDFSFSADEKRMIASGLLGAIYPIDLVTGKFKAVDGPGYLGALDLWSFSRDLRTGLCVNGNNVEVWDMASQKIVGNMPLKDGSLKAAFLPDERRVVTSDMTDGIVVWDLSDPTAPKRLGSFLAVSDGRWLAMDGEGRFDAADPSAAEGASYVYGWSGGLEPIEISQMKSRYYEPGLLGKLLGIDPAPRRAVPDVAALQIYPEVRLSAKEDRFGIEVSDRDDGGVGTVELFVNGKSFKRRKGGGFFNVDFDSLRPFLIPPARLRPGERNELRVVAGNESDDLRSPSVGEEIPLPADLSAPPVHMYALCAGVGDYVGTTGDLKSPPSDATAIADALRKVSKRLLPEGVEVTVLTTDAKTEDGRPSRARLALWFEETSRKATASDIV
ncbi:WD40 repeat domain-containing protein, partial [bacterium]